MDFRREKLLLFAWSGSGGDRLNFWVKAKDVHFSFSPGRTRDLRPHVEAFALAKGVKYEVANSAPLAMDRIAAPPQDGLRREGTSGIEAALEEQLQELGKLAREKLRDRAEGERSAQ